MGIYLNPDNDASAEEAAALYVDKTLLIEQTNLRLSDPSNKFICVSRPRRFGKSIAEDMLSAYYSKGADSRELFSRFKIASLPSFEVGLNKYNVIKIDLNSMSSKWKTEISKEETVDNVIDYVTLQVCDEFREEFPEIAFGKNDSISAFIQKVYAKTKEKFIIIIDEYDVLVREQVSEKDFDIYLAFLISLFKNAELKPAIALAYLTGILPVIRDTRPKQVRMVAQSKLNTFQQFTMLDVGGFEEFIGFTTEEVKTLCEKYNRNFEECRAGTTATKSGSLKSKIPKPSFMPSRLAYSSHIGALLPLISSLPKKFR